MSDNRSHGIPGESDHAKSQLNAPVDFAKGLRNVAGNEQLFRKILGEFAKDHGRDVVAARELIALGQLPDAFRILHTLKGLVGTIGANECQAQAEHCVELLRSDHVPEDVHLASLQDSLQAVCHWIEQLPDVAPHQNLSMSPDDLTRLRTMIEEMDPGAEQLLEEYAEALDKRDHEAFVALRDHLHRFDFEAALVPFERLVKKES